MLKLGFYLEIQQPLFRSDIPSEIVVEHSETEEIGITSTSITCDVENASVTLWNGDSLIGKSNVLNGKLILILIQSTALTH